MGRKLKTTTIKEELDNNGLPNIDDDGNNSGPMMVEDDALSFILSKLDNQSVALRITKQAPDGKFEFIDKIHKDDFEDLEEHIQTQYGSGKYMIRVFHNGMETHRTLLRIADKPGTVKEENLSGMTPELRMYREQNMFYQNILLRMIGSGNGSGNGSGSNIKDIAEIISMLGLQQKSSIGSSDAVQLITKGMDIAAKAQSGADWKTELLSMGKEILPGILERLPQNINPNPPVANHMQIQEPNTMAVIPLPMATVKLALSQLKKYVLKGMDTDLAFDWILNNADEAPYTELLTFVLQSKYEDFVNLDAELANEPFKSWIQKLHKDLINEYQSHNDINKRGSNGNVGDTKVNAKSGKERD